MVKILWYRYCENVLGAGILKHFMGARNRVGIGLYYRPARLHRLAEFNAWNLFLGFINVKNTGSA
jgi:hypothetical protein